MFTSYRVVEMVRQAISTEYVTASDTDVAKALGVGRATISAYKHGKAKMPSDTTARALALIKAEPFEKADIYFRHMLEISSDEKQRKFWLPLQNLCHTLAQSGKSGARKAGAFILAILAAGMLIAPAGNQAQAASVASAEGYTLCEVRRRLRRARRRWLRFFTIFPIATLATGCSALDTREEQVWQALHVVDSAQTFNIVDDPNFHEADPLTSRLIGREPSRRGVIAWAVSTAALHAGVTAALIDTNHPAMARAWNYLTIGAVATTVGHNFYIGIRIGGANNPKRH